MHINQTERRWLIDHGHDKNNGQKIERYPARIKVVEIHLNGIQVAREARWTAGYTEIPLSEAATAALKAGRNVLALHCR